LNFARGGSASGSAAWSTRFVRTEDLDFVLAHDTGEQVREAAAFLAQTEELDPGLLLEDCGR
jgi:hypothetical protein